MSRINGEKARANVTNRNRTKRRATDRARLAQIKASNEQQEPAPKKRRAVPAQLQNTPNGSETTT